MDKARGSSFFVPMLLMRRRKRRAMLALYGFCRAVDDAVDEAASVAQAQANLSHWEAELAAIFEGSPREPVALRLKQAVQAFGLPRAPLEALLAAMRADAATSVRLADEAALAAYCYGAAGCVGLEAMVIFGLRGAAAEAFALALGEALQLTNILRDLEEDARRDRCYLPLSWLEPAGLDWEPCQAILRQVARLEPLRKRLLEQAAGQFAEARRLARALPVRPLTPALLMRDVYRIQWERLRRGGVFRRGLNGWETRALFRRALRYRVLGRL